MKPTNKERKDNRPSNLGGKKPPAPRTNGAPHTKAPKQEPNRTKINRNDKEDKNVKNTKPFARPRHDIETMHNPHPASALNQLQDKIPDHLHRFCNGLKNHSTPELLVTNNVHHWIQAFSLSYEAPHLMKIHLFWLAKVLVNLPDKDKYTPDPTHVLKVVKEIVTSTKRDPPFDLIFKVAERLQSSTSTRKISNPKALIDILAELEDEIATLFRRARRRDDEEDNDHILSRYKQLEVVLDEYRPVIRKASTSRQNNSTDESLSCMRWYRDPNIQWLLDAEWLSIPTLHEKYSSVDDYVQTIQKLWTSMTFYWGASVFFPRCRSREGPNPDKTCQNPVLSLPHHHSQTCNNMVSVNGHTDVCGKPAKYCCYRRGHDAICGDCLNKRRAGLLGKPGPNASTDFYDAQVTKISSRNDSIVLQLNRLKSRKPPEADINWATSYRLQISNLVGVVPLATANSSLNGSLPFYLGEIIALEAIPDELRKKRNGELSVRLLSRNDSALLSNSTTLTLGRNDHVGIIDFRVFVPEVISVLSTICHSSFNDAFTRVRFAQPLLGNISHLGDPQEVYRGLDCNAQIYHAIMHSTIRSLQTLSIQAKQIIIRDLCSIRVIQTMDRTQLLAFCAGLQNALHCIQGPPGTGKSYTGVALIVALQRIKRAIETETKLPLGPIVTLSYKNHALDELLLDLLKCDPQLRLIRLGKPDAQQLQPYTERTCLMEVQARKDLEYALKVLQRCEAFMRQCFSPVSFQSMKVWLAKMVIFAKIQYFDFQDLKEDSSFQILENIANMDTEDFPTEIAAYSQLFIEARFWRRRPIDALDEWLKGSSLPFRCKAKDQKGGQCDTAALDGFEFCAAHKCHTKNCSNTRSLGKFCADHACLYQGCGNSVFGENVVYCQEHVCRVCLQAQRLEGTVVCFEHTCSEQNCTAPRIFNTSYCQQHQCIVCSEEVADLYKMMACDRPLCEMHKCAFEDCIAQRWELNDVSTLPLPYCSGHTCLLCLQEGEGLFMASYPCGKHNKCDRCGCSIALDVVMCDACSGEHLKPSKEVFCSGVTTKNKPCKARPASTSMVVCPWYCDSHRDQMVPLPAPRGNPVQASANQVNKHIHCSGAHCPLMAVNVSESWMCSFHVEVKARHQNRCEPAVVPPKPPVDPVGIAEDRSSAANLERNTSTGEPNRPKEAMFVPLANPDEDMDDEEGDYERFDERNEVYQSDDEIEDVEMMEDQCFVTDDDAAIDWNFLISMREKLMGWSWDWSLEVRTSKAQELANMIGYVIRSLIRKAEGHIESIRRRREDANAGVLRRAVVIGGTVVGAVKRLPALRAAEPFAIVVEEACEVMEPILVSVLAVESVQKLELVGDHQQLPAFINTNWFNFEMTIPRIKKSLFERLIDNDNRSGKLCTVLDVQRRMKPYISDITRSFYASEVTIMDDDRAKVQKIGDRVLPSHEERKSLSKYIPLWHSGGRDVPGMGMNLYFWDLPSNKESPPKVGLSACNEMEAFAVAALTKYLQTCGVPSSSITIITPYQGQKRVLIKILRDMKCIPGHHMPANDSSPRITVSTVDRYQGDENDIVILSLVRTRPGNRFVSLINRFIVATSRARIGFYIIGSLSAVANDPNTLHSGPTVQAPKHWQQLVNDLAATARLGNSIPICCPQHARSKRQVGQFPAVDTWGQFCAEKCGALLPCGHTCAQLCHVHNPSAHTTQCQQIVNRGCLKHPDEVAPCYIKTSSECPRPTIQPLPYCSHTLMLPCFEVNAIALGRKSAPKCEVVIARFDNPACGHAITNITCDVRRQYSLNPPRCMEMVPKQSTQCGHNYSIECYRKSEPYECKIRVDSSRPRCQHQISMLCRDARLLKQLYSTHTASLTCFPCVGDNNRTTVIEVGKQYGPAEKDIPSCSKIVECKVDVDIARTSCDHRYRLPCHDAFEAVRKNAIPICALKVPFKCPFCSGDLSIECHQKSDPRWAIELRQFNRSNFFQPDGTVDLSKLTEQPSRNPLWYMLSTPFGISQELPANRLSPGLSTLLSKLNCSSSIRFRRACGHIIEKRCSEIVKMIADQRFDIGDCTALLPKSRPDCAHQVLVRCCDRDLPITERCVEVVNQVYNHSCGHNEVARLCCDYTFIKTNPRCSQLVESRLIRCGHAVYVTCADKLLCQEMSKRGKCLEGDLVDEAALYCQMPPALPRCTAPVRFRRKCGHIIQNMLCAEAFDYALGSMKASALPCNETVPVMNPICGHKGTMPCAGLEAFRAWDPWENLVRPIPTSIMTSQGQAATIYSLPLVSRPIVPAAILLSACTCRITARYKHCGHIVDHLTCSQVFLKNPSCGVIVQVKCSDPECGVVQELVCSEASKISAQELKLSCPGVLRRPCMVCNVNMVSKRCGDVAILDCKAVVEVDLPCGHRARWRCCDGLNDLRQFHDFVRNINEKCWQCVTGMWQRCIDDYAAFVEQLQSHAEQMIEDVCHTDAFVVSDTVSLQQFINLELHERDCKRIIQAIIENITVRGNKVHDVTPSFPIPSATSVDQFLEEHYSLVFLPIAATHQAVVPDKAMGRLGPRPTRFGLGVLACTASVESLVDSFSVQQSSRVRCILASVFTANMLQGVEPFRADEPGAKRDNGANTNERQCELTKQKYQREGYDCVEVGDSQRILWNAGALIPHVVLDLELRSKCSICFDVLPVDAQKGAICRNNHLCCWECFQEYLDLCNRVDALETYFDQDGCITCPTPNCRIAYDIARVAAAAPDPAMAQAVIDLKVKRLSDRAVQEQAHDMQLRFEKELELLRNMDEDQRQLHMMVREVQENMLTLRCPNPNCRRVFADFDACCAVQCSGAGGCNHYFCAFCFHVSTGDLHAHVANCHYNPKKGDVFATEESIRKVWQERKKAKVREYLDKLPPAKREKLAKALEKDLRDNQIRL